MNDVVHIGNRPSVAIVEDDPDLRQSIRTYLQAKGYSTWSEGSAEAFYKRLLVEPVQVVVLDIGLPGESGFDVARHLQEVKGIEVIMLSGRSALEDRLRGLSEGASRYLVKPVDLRELEANIAASQRSASASPSEAAGEWQLLEAEWILLSPRGEKISLTSREWAFMSCIVQTENRTASRAAIATSLHGPNLENFDYHRLDMIVSRLRQKITNATGRIAPIRTLQSQGFTFSAKCRLL